MKTLYFNPETKVVFGSDDPQNAPIHAIDVAEVADLQAMGASVDADSTNEILGKSDSTATASTDVAPAVPAPDASVTSSDTATDPAPAATPDGQATPDVQADAVPLAVGGADSGNVNAVASDSANATAATDAASNPPVDGSVASIVMPTTTEIIPVESVKTTEDVANPADSIAAGPGASIDPQAAVPNEVVEGSDALPPPKDVAEEQAQANAGVDTTKDPQNVVIHGPVGSIAGAAVTPDGTPVVEAQPDAVTVKGPEVPASQAAAISTSAVPDSVAQLNPYHELSHEDKLDRLLQVMEGIAAMGKAEIQAELMLLRAAFKR